MKLEGRASFTSKSERSTFQFPASDVLRWGSTDLQSGGLLVGRHSADAGRSLVIRHRREDIGALLNEGREGQDFGLFRIISPGP